MARFCTNCGSPVGEDLSFCSQCGKPMGPAGVPAPVAAVPTPAAIPATQPAPAAPAPAKGSSPIVKIILIVVLILVFIAVAGIGACVYGVYRAKRAVREAIQMDKSGRSVEIQTPGGPLKLGPQAAKPGDMVAGVPVYPGATALEGGGQFSFGDKFSIGGQDFVTDDDVEKVVDFYKEKLGSDLSVVQNEGHYRLSIQKGTKEHPTVVTIDVAKDQNSGKTKITIAHMGGGAAQ